MGRPAGHRGLAADALAAVEAAGPGGLLGTVPLRVLRDAVLSGDPGCVADPELFTGPSGIEPEEEPEQDRAARIDAAREVCADCPVRRPCLAWAVRSLPAAGVWAGLLPDEIAALAAAAECPGLIRVHQAPRPGAIAGVA